MIIACLGKRHKAGRLSRFNAFQLLLPTTIATIHVLDLSRAQINKFYYWNFLSLILGAQGLKC